jgi:hypothetical protein
VRGLALEDWSQRWVVNWRLLFRVNSDLLTGESCGILTEQVMAKPSLLYTFLLETVVLFCSLMLVVFFLLLDCLGMLELFLDLDVLVFVEFRDRFLILGLARPCKWEVMELLRSKRWI